MKSNIKQASHHHPPFFLLNARSNLSHGDCAFHQAIIKFIWESEIEVFQLAKLTILIIWFVNRWLTPLLWNLTISFFKET